MCNHQTCATLRSNNAGRGVGIAILVNYYRSFKCILLGRENGGNYAGMYNIIGGSMEQCDNGCWVAAAYRECVQESKFQITHTILGSAPYIMQGRTPIFCVEVQGLKRATLNTQISAANATPTLPWCEREMSDVQFIHLNTQRIINNVGGAFIESPTVVSSYASSVISQILKIWK